jgi:hypothetical protein
MATTSELLKVGDALCWIEDGESIRLKATTRDGQPAVLDAIEARAVAEMLLKLARGLDSASTGRHRIP